LLPKTEQVHHYPFEVKNKGGYTVLFSVRFFYYLVTFSVFCRLLKEIYNLCCTFLFSYIHYKLVTQLCMLVLFWNILNMFQINFLDWLYRQCFANFQPVIFKIEKHVFLFSVVFFLSLTQYKLTIWPPLAMLSVTGTYNYIWCLFYFVPLCFNLRMHEPEASKEKNILQLQNYLLQGKNRNVPVKTRKKELN